MTATALPGPLLALLAGSLVLWDVRGWVIMHGPEKAVVHTESGAQIRVARFPAGHPMRWRVEGDSQARSCLSIVGALGAVREMLGVTAGPGLRLAPVRSDA